MDRNIEKYLNIHYSDIINEVDGEMIKQIKNTLHYSICMLIYTISDFKNAVLNEIKKIIIN